MKNLITFRKKTQKYIGNSFSRYLLIACLAGSVTSINAQSDGLPRGADQMPYERYESENARTSGGASVQGPTYDQKLLASEASDRRFVSLASAGSSVEWTVQDNAQDGLTLRYSIPDNTQGTLALYVNNQKVRDIALTSYWAWQYFTLGAGTSGNPTNTPSGSSTEPRMRFDELHFILDTPLNNGDVVKLQKDTNDGNAYGIDFIELENAPDPIAKPEGFISVTDYGATPDDDTNDVLAFREAIDIANGDPTIRGVYVPAGRFIHGAGGATSGVLFIGNENFAFQGAGMWHTELYFSQSTPNAVGILFNADAIKFSDMYLNTANNSRTAGNKGTNGTVGKNSVFENIWMEHFETGFWLTSIRKNGAWNVTDGLEIRNCRVRNVYADGTNLTKGTRNTVVEQVNYRNCIDDAMAVWSVNFLEDVPPEPSINNRYSNNTVENNLRAAGVGFFGGYGHSADHLLIKDSFAGPGIRVNTQFPAYSFGNNASQAIDISECTVTGSGTTLNIFGNRFGAIELQLVKTSPPGQSYSLQYVNFTNIDVIDSQHDAVFINSFTPEPLPTVLDNVFFTNLTIDGTGTALDVNNGPNFTSGSGESGGHGLYAANYSPNNDFNGWVEVAGVSFNNIAGEEITYFQSQPEFEIRLTNGPDIVDVTGVSIEANSLELTEGESANVAFSIQPGNANNRSVSWSSSDAAVVSVNSRGEITALREGTATVTVTTAQGNFTDSVVVTVSADRTTLASLSISNSQISEDQDSSEITISATNVDSEITVNYTVSGNASADDYTATPGLNGSVVLRPGTESQTVLITAIDDTVLEANETIEITLVSGNGYEVSDASNGTITIRDNEEVPCAAPTIAITGGAPTIDGIVDATWANAPAMPIANTIAGNPSPDYSGSWKAIDDANFLYVLVNVSDATLTNDSGAEWWNDDTVEIFIDGNNSKASNYDGVDDVQLGFRWDDDTVNFGGNSLQNISGIQFSMVATTNGYTLEVAIPRSGLNASAQLGDQIGFDVVIDDDDNGGARDSQVASLSTSTEGWNNPGVFGSVFLTNCNGGVNPPNNQAPIANAGADQSVADTVTSVSLQGSGSDPDGDAITYAWSQTSGATTVINSLSSATTSVDGLTAGNTYTYTLTVSDGRTTATDTVTVTVANSGVVNPPTGSGFTIQNVWNQEYLRDGGVTVQYGNAPTSAEYFWTLEDVANGVEIKNVATGEYMHLENLTGSIECTERNPNWFSSRWVTSDAGEGSVRVRNQWQSDQYIHVENLTGNAQHGTIFPAWSSARWLFSESANGLKAVSLSNDNGKIALYPNPATSTVTLQYANVLNGSEYYTISSLTGKIVAQKALTAESTVINAESFSAGVYVIEVVSSTSKQSTKLVVE